MKNSILMIVLLASCDQARVGDDCSARYHCSVIDGVATCDEGFEFVDADDPTNYRCIESGCQTEGATRCSGKIVQTCASSEWVTLDTCTQLESCVVAGDRSICRNMSMQCGPNGQDSCINGSELVRCTGGYYEPLQTCDDACIFVNDALACEGGSRTFSPNNVGVLIDGAFRASISNVSGAIGCGLRDNYENTPGLASESVYLLLANTGFGCPTGTYGLDQGCDVSYPSSSSARCAIYRRWNADRLESVEALAGAVTISGTSISCTVQVDLVAGGQQMSTRFTADVQNGEVCTQPN